MTLVHVSLRHWPTYSVLANGRPHCHFHVVSGDVCISVRLVRVWMSFASYNQGISIFMSFRWDSWGTQSQTGLSSVSDRWRKHPVCCRRLTPWQSTDNAVMECFCAMFIEVDWFHPCDGENHLGQTPWWWAQQPTLAVQRDVPSTGHWLCCLQRCAGPEAGRTLPLIEVDWFHPCGGENHLGQTPWWWAHQPTVAVQRDVPSTGHWLCCLQRCAGPEAGRALPSHDLWYSTQWDQMLWDILVCNNHILILRLVKHHFYHTSNLSQSRHGRCDGDWLELNVFFFIHRSIHHKGRIMAYKQIRKRNNTPLKKKK